MDYKEIGKRLVCLPGVRIEFDGEADTAEHTQGLSRGETRFVSVGVNSPEAQSFSHYLSNPGNLSADDDSDLSYYNSCAWGDATKTLEEQRVLVLHCFGPAKTLGMGVISVHKPPSTRTPGALEYSVSIQHGEKEILTTRYLMGLGRIPGWISGQYVADCPAIDEVVRTGSGGLRIVERGFYQYVPGPPILPDPDHVISSIVTDAGAANYSSFEEWAVDFDYDPDSRSAESIYRECRRTGHALKKAVGRDWMRALRLWAAEQ